MVLAVKPQSMAEALSEVRALAAPGTLILSIAAGVRLATLEAAFPAGQADRSRHAQHAGASRHEHDGRGRERQRHRDRARRVDALLTAIGKLAWIDDEALLDAVTAVSGSGPAYVFLLAECLAEAGAQGRAPRCARGAACARRPWPARARSSPRARFRPDVLRKNVTSPAGTTEAALSVLMADGGLQPLLDRAVEAAKKRSIELG